MQSQNEPNEEGLAPTADAQRKNASTKRALRATNRDEALRLRAQGLSFDQIGLRLKVSPRTAAEWVRRAIASAPEEAVEDVRSVELQRLDMLVVGHLARAVKGDTKSAEIVLKTMERRAKFLNLDQQAQAGLQEVGSLLDRLVFGPEGDGAEG